MFVYEVLGWTAKIDWTDRSEKISFGLFSTEEKAEAFITEKKSDADWRMTWDKFTVVEREVK